MSMRRIGGTPSAGWSGVLGSRRAWPFDKEDCKSLICQSAALSTCLAISFPVFRTCRPPGRGRRVRYGKLRFPSCTPFHPPGAPLPWLSYLLGPRSGPVDFPGKSTRATSRSASATTTFLRAWHVFEGGLQSLCFREKSFAPPERCARLSAAKGRAVEQRLPAWRMGKEPGTAVRVTQRAKEGRRLKELESRKNVDNGTRC